MVAESTYKMMATPLREIAGSTVVLAGASSGFGRGAALELAQQGARVVVAARRRALLEELVGQIEREGGKATAVATDVSSEDDVRRLAAAAIERYGRIDVWINNVGVGALGYFWEIPRDVHARVVDVNLKGLIYGAHAALSHFVARGQGTLINVGSIDSEVPLALQNTYAATKAGVLSLGRSLNEELRLAGYAERIKVATIMPWAVDTPWWKHAANFTGHKPRMMAMDDPQIVVNAIVRACTDPKEEMPVGPKAHLSKLSHHIFPDLTERLSANIAEREKEKGEPAPNTSGSLFVPMADGRGVRGGVRERMEIEDARSN